MHKFPFQPLLLLLRLPQRRLFFLPYFFFVGTLHIPTLLAWNNTPRTISMRVSKSFPFKAAATTSTTATATAVPMIPRAAVSVVVQCSISYDSLSKNHEDNNNNNKKNYFLLVQRGNPPAKDLWSFPGGKIEWGESTLQAAIRELQEETKWDDRDNHFTNNDLDSYQLEWYHGTICTTDSIGSSYHYMIAQCYAQVKLSNARSHILPTVTAADDAIDVGWYTVEDIATLNTTPGLDVIIHRIEQLNQYGMLPTSTTPIGM